MTSSILSPALRTVLAIGLAAPLWLVACRQEPEPQEDGRPANIVLNREGGAQKAAAVASGTVAAVPSQPTNLAIAPTDAAVQNRTSQTPDSMKGETGARAVLLDWARALERGDWARARAQWGHDGGDSGLSPDAFARSYQKYQHITVGFGDGMVEGAAGSLYYEVPVTLTGTLRDGRVETLTGPVTLRRVNDVDGASAADLRWHISSGELRPRP